MTDTSYTVPSLVRPLHPLALVRSALMIFCSLAFTPLMFLSPVLIIMYGPLVVSGWMLVRYEFRTGSLGRWYPSGRVTLLGLGWLGIAVVVMRLLLLFLRANI